MYAVNQTTLLNQLIRKKTRFRHALITHTTCAFLLYLGVSQANIITIYNYTNRALTAHANSCASNPRTENWDLKPYHFTSPETHFITNNDTVTFGKIIYGQGRPFIEIWNKENNVRLGIIEMHISYSDYNHRGSCSWKPDSTPLPALNPEVQKSSGWTENTTYQPNVYHYWYNCAVYIYNESGEFSNMK